MTFIGIVIFWRELFWKAESSIDVNWESEWKWTNLRFLQKLKQLTSIFVTLDGIDILSIADDLNASLQIVTSLESEGKLTDLRL